MTIGGTAVGSVGFGSRAGGSHGTRDLLPTKSSGHIVKNHRLGFNI